MYQTAYLLHACEAVAVRVTVEAACNQQVRAASGASGSVVLLDTGTQKVHVACVGGGNAILGELLHGLAKQVAEAALLFPPPPPGSASLIGMGRLRDPQLAGDMSFHSP
jgi:hypothetical protein